MQIKQNSDHLNQVNGEEIQFYDYLLMKFEVLILKQLKRLSDQHPQLNQAKQTTNSRQRSLVGLFVMLENLQFTKDNKSINNLQQNNDVKGKERCEKFIKKVTDYYPVIFESINEGQSKGLILQIQVIEHIMYEVIRKCSCLNVINRFIKQNKLKNDRKSPEEVNIKHADNNLLVGTSKEIVDLDLLLFIVTLIIKQGLIESQFIFKTDFIGKINQLVLQAFNQIMSSTTILESDQNFQKQSIAITSPYICQIIKSYLQSELFIRTLQNIVSTLFSLSILQHQQESLTKQLLQNYHLFQLKFKFQPSDINPKIFQLHLIEEILNLNLVSPIFQVSHSQISFLQQTHLQLKCINLINYYRHQNQLKINLNKSLLKLYKNQPYKTSLFILYTFLHHSGIKNCQKFFQFQYKSKKTTSNSNNNYVDPLIFLLIDKKLITNQNSQIISISLWTVLDVWIKFIQRKAKQNLQIFNRNIQIPKINTSNQTTFQKNNPIQYKLNIQDPRKIYAIKQKYSTIGNQQSKSSQHPINFENQINKKNQQVTSSKDVDIKYKRILMRTIIFYLLTIDCQTTILKYFPIENDLIKQMIQSQIFPVLLTKNKYLFVNNQFHLNNSNCEQTENGQKQLQIKLRNAQSLKQIQILQKELKQIKDKYLFTNLQKKESLFQNYKLPWMNLIQSTQILIKLLQKPCGFDLALKIIQRHPYTFEKKYQSLIPKMIFAQIQQNFKQYKLVSQSKQTKKQNIENSKIIYRMQGNKNVKCKKTLTYNKVLIEKQQANMKKTNNLQQGQQKLFAMKQILLIYKQKGKDDIIKKICQKFLNVI